MNLPKHIAIIPDGNRRWAKSRGSLPWRGHAEGFKRFEEIAFAALDTGIPYVTFWAASRDNLEKRPPAEIRALVRLMRQGLEKAVQKKLFERHRARVRIIGVWRNILNDKKLSAAIDALERQTENHGERTLTILFGYDGREEMLDAIKQMNDRTSVTAEALQSKLWTGHLPPVDLVIRTGGEPHWSAGFMMWATANSQFHFTEILWPEFGKREFSDALADFAARERRLGK